MSAAILLLLLGGARVIRPPLPELMGASIENATPVARANAASPVASSVPASPLARASIASPTADVADASPTASVSRGNREWT